MKKGLPKTKWTILWSFLVGAALVYFTVAIILPDETWSNLWIQLGAMVLTIGSAILIMLSNNEKSDEGTQKQLDLIQENTTKQIKALQESTAKQNEHLTTLTNNHISAHKAEIEKQSEIIREGNNKQIENIQNSTEKQISALQNESLKQMEHISNLTAQQIDENRKEYEKQNSIIADGNKKQIENIQSETERQIKALQDEFKKHMTHLSELTNKHIETNEKASAKQVNAIKEEAQKQVDSFIKQTQEITDRLEDVSEHLTTLAQLNGQMIQMEMEMKQLEEEKLKKREKELVEQKFELAVDKARLKPLLAYRLEDLPHNIFWQWINVFITNQGGDASSIRIYVTFRTENNSKTKTASRSFMNVRRGQTVSFRGVRTKQVSDCNIIEVKISAWDINQREYHANLWWYRMDNYWFKIDLSENQNLALEMSDQKYLG